MSQRHLTKESRPADAVLKAFQRRSDDVVREIKLTLRTRSFVTENNCVVTKVIDFLNEAAPHIPAFEQAHDLIAKTEFLKSLVRAWEIADATGIFDNHNLKTYQAIKKFSTSRLDKIAELTGNSKISALEKVYWQEVARAGLIHIAELYRSHNLNRCRHDLGKLLDFVEKKLVDREMHCDGILGQIFYFSSKVNRYDGKLDIAENDLNRAAERYSIKAQRLAATAKEIEQKACRSDGSILKGEVRDIRERLVEVILRTGVIEVSRAWLYFRQGNYKAAKHSANTALLLLSPSGDELTQYHARLVSAAVDRVRSRSARELDETVTKLNSIREFFLKKEHSRLRARTEYELLLALILLDSMLGTDDHEDVKNNAPLKQAEKLIRKRSDCVTDRWGSLKLTLQSRFLRHVEMKREVGLRNFESAVEYAQMALKKAGNSNNQDCQIEALIALAEAHFEQTIVKLSGPKSERDDTVSDTYPMPPSARDAQKQTEAFSLTKGTLSQALDVCLKTDFPELMAIVRLLLARVAVRVNLYDEADYHLHEFRRIKLQEHAWVQRLNEKVFSEYHRQDYLILQEEQLTKGEAFLALKRFLIDKAQRKAKREKGKVTDSLVADILQISRQTLLEWRREINSRRTSGEQGTEQLHSAVRLSHAVRIRDR